MNQSSSHDNPIISPMVLKSARKRVELDLKTAAKKLGVEPHILKKWEAGEKTPTYKQLRKASNIYKLSIFDFLKEKLPEKKIPEYRSTNRDHPIEGKPLEYYDALQRAEYQRKVLLNLKEDFPELFSKIESKKIPTLKISKDPEEIELASKALRKFVGVDFSTQRGWGDETLALKEWIRNLSKIGILIIQFSKVDVREIRGFSIYESQFPIIAINTKDSKSAKIFTLFHELTHIALGESSACELNELSNESTGIEQFCNRVAASILMPREELLENNTIAKATSEYKWSLEETVGLAKKFKVSLQALLIRLMSIQKSNFSTNKGLLDEQKSQRERESEQKKKTSGGQYYPSHVQKLGKAYVEIILEAYHSKRISKLDTAHYLEAKLGNISKIDEFINSSK